PRPPLPDKLDHVGCLHNVMTDAGRGSPPGRARSRLDPGSRAGPALPAGGRTVVMPGGRQPMAVGPLTPVTACPLRFGLAPNPACRRETTVMGSQPRGPLCHAN